MKPYAIYLKSAKYLAEGIISQDPNESLTDRQERILGFNQSVMDNLRVLLIGAGGKVMLRHPRITTNGKI